MLRIHIGPCPACGRRYFAIVNDPVHFCPNCGNMMHKELEDDFRNAYYDIDEDRIDSAQKSIELIRKKYTSPNSISHIEKETLRTDCLIGRKELLAYMEAEKKEKLMASSPIVD